MSKYDDFTGNNSFYHDDKGNNIYELNDIHYIVNDANKRNELKNLEGYRYFFYGTQKPVSLFVSFFFIAFPLTILLTVWFPNININIIPLLIAFPIHLLFRSFYNKKIEKILEGCPILQKYKDCQKEKKVEEELLKQESQQITIKKPKKEDKKIYYSPYKRKEKSLIEKIKYITSDYNFLHLILFMIIAAPFLMVVYYIVKAWLTN